MPITPDRRQHSRHAAEIACKILQDADCRYRTALTADVSAGGALLTLRTPKPMRVGEPLRVSVNWTGGALMSRADLVTATVVRAGPMLDSAQRVAVKFDEPQFQAESFASVEAA